MNQLPQQLEMEVVERIHDFISANSELLIQDSLLTKPMGQRVFDIVKQKAILVFYPIEDRNEENNAFSLFDLPAADGTGINFVYINTNKTIEKQIYAAAHELGHLLFVDKYVKEEFPDIEEDLIVNRFAAEILMPSEQFKRIVMTSFAEKADDHVITWRVLFYAIIEAMEYFLVPYEAAAIRLLETDVLPLNEVDFLISGDAEFERERIDKIIEHLIGERMESKLLRIDRKREIEGLEHLLNKAEEKKPFLSKKILRLRKEFNLLGEEQEIRLNQIINVEESGSE